MIEGNLYFLSIGFVHWCTIMNVIQVLTLTTIAYFLFVTFWILKMEDYLQTREERQYENEQTRGEV